MKDRICYSVGAGENDGLDFASKTGKQIAAVI